MALESIKGFGVSEKYIQRQTFARMLRNLYKIDKFKDIFMDLVNELAEDKVIVVRIALAISIRSIIN